MSKILSQETTWEFDGSEVRKFRVIYEDKKNRDTRIYLEELEEEDNEYEVNKVIEMNRKDLQELYAIIHMILNTEKL